MMAKSTKRLHFDPMFKNINKFMDSINYANAAIVA